MCHLSFRYRTDHCKNDKTKSFRIKPGQLGKCICEDCSFKACDTKATCSCSRYAVRAVDSYLYLYVMKSSIYTVQDHMRLHNVSSDAFLLQNPVQGSSENCASQV